jgi:Ca2+-binding EF-hand superfamily protein
LTKERLWATFKYFDKDNSGLITKENLKNEIFKECGMKKLSNEQ